MSIEDILANVFEESEEPRTVSIGSVDSVFFGRTRTLEFDTWWIWIEKMAEIAQFSHTNRFYEYRKNGFGTVRVDTQDSYKRWYLTELMDDVEKKNFVHNRFTIVITFGDQKKQDERNDFVTQIVAHHTFDCVCETTEYIWKYPKGPEGPEGHQGVVVFAEITTNGGERFHTLRLETLGGPCQKVSEFLEALLKTNS